MSQATYDLKSVKLPRLAGGGLRAFVALIENPATRGLIIPKLLRDGGIAQLREITIDEPPTFHPRLDARASNAAPLDLARFAQAPRARGKGFAFATVRDYADVYRASATTPEKIAEQMLSAIDDSNTRTPACPDKFQSTNW